VQRRRQVGHARGIVIVLRDFGRKPKNEQALRSARQQDFGAARNHGAREVPGVAWRAGKDTKVIERRRDGLHAVRVKKAVGRLEARHAAVGSRPDRRAGGLRAERK
jgi:hypothetical protein